MSATVLLIAIDAAGYQLFETCRRAGHLPALQALAKGAVVHPIEHQDGMTDDSLWASFQYAVPPGGHGRYHWKRDRGRDGRFDFCTDGEEDLVAFWEPLCAAGFRVAVFDVPKSRLTHPRNGLHLANWLVHGRYGDRATSSPPDLAAEVTSRFGPPPPSRCNDGNQAFSPREIMEIVDNLRASVQCKRDAAKHYLGSRPWDLFMTSFKELHCASHLLWPVTPGIHDAAIGARGDDSPLLTVFKYIDDAIADLASSSKASAIAIFGTTGMTANRTIDHLVPQILQRLSARHQKPPRATGDWIPPIAHQLDYNEDSLALRVQQNDPGLSTDIGLSLAGLRDFDSGVNLFASIQYPREQWPGKRASRLPDLVASLDRRLVSPTRIVSDRLGIIAGEPPALRAGNHAGDGVGIFSPALSTLLTSTRIGIHEIGPAIQSIVGAVGRKGSLRSRIGS